MYSRFKALNYFFIILLSKNKSFCKNCNCEAREGVSKAVINIGIMRQAVREDGLLFYALRRNA